jgi:hypothetical protein
MIHLKRNRLDLYMLTWANVDNIFIHLQSKLQNDQGLTLARQGLFHLSHAPALFALGFFHIESHTYILVTLDKDPPIYTS